jgi:hypothetical protein
VLPLVVRDVLNTDVRRAIVKVCRVFRRICDKKINLQERATYIEDVAVVLSMLEREFPPTFQDIKIHVLIHLVEELFICGLVHSRWMYPMERYMKILKDFVRTYARLEGSIVEGYAMEDTLGLCTEYLTRYSPTARKVWDEKEDQTMVDEMLQGRVGMRRNLDSDERHWAHEFVIENAAHLENYRK